jgi:glycosyltransferase involved in cell wall biosynthesis
MASAVARSAARISADWDFDLIDAHWAHPAGIAAVRLGRRLCKPVVITGRGTDVAELPNVPVIGRQIRSALAHATHCIGVSSEIASRMIELGAQAATTTVVPNGVDTAKFRPLSMEEARRKLGLPIDAKVILSVGDRFENKGFHLLIDALPRIRRQHPNAVVAIVGGPPRFGADYTSEIERRIQVHGVEKHVVLAGPRAHDELPWWYSAADVFALLSAREGSPNVLMEALSCGTPAVGTPVGGIADVLRNRSLGLTLSERSSAEAARVLTDALSTDWDRGKIRRIVQPLGWEATARSIADVFETMLAAARPVASRP